MLLSLFRHHISCSSFSALLFVISSLSSGLLLPLPSVLSLVSCRCHLFRSWCPAVAICPALGVLPLSSVPHSFVHFFHLSCSPSPPPILPALAVAICPAIHLLPLSSVVLYSSPSASPPFGLLLPLPSVLPSSSAMPPVLHFIFCYAALLTPPPSGLLVALPSVLLSSSAMPSVLHFIFCYAALLAPPPLSMLPCLLCCCHLSCSCSAVADICPIILICHCHLSHSPFCVAFYPISLATYPLLAPLSNAMFSACVVSFADGYHTKIAGSASSVGGGKRVTTVLPWD